MYLSYNFWILIFYTKYVKSLEIVQDIENSCYENLEMKHFLNSYILVGYIRLQRWVHVKKSILNISKDIENPCYIYIYRGYICCYRLLIEIVHEKNVQVSQRYLSLILLQVLLEANQRHWWKCLKQRLAAEFIVKIYCFDLVWHLQLMMSHCSFKYMKIL